MTVSELIIKLKQYPPGASIVVEGYENGFDDIENIKEVSVVPLSDKKWWDGKYTGGEKADAMKAIVLLGNRKAE